MEQEKKSVPEGLGPIARYLIPLEQLWHFRPPPTVYLLLGPYADNGAEIAKERVLYVGQSIRAQARAGAHRAHKHFDRVLCFPVAEKFLDAAEVVLIDLLKPPLNRKMGRRTDPHLLRQVREGLGLGPNAKPPPLAPSELADFTPAMAKSIWRELGATTQRAVYWLAENGRYSERDANAPWAFSNATRSSLATAARERLKARSPVIMKGLKGSRTYRLTRPVARAFAAASETMGFRSW